MSHAARLHEDGDPVVAPAAGRIAALHVKPGDTITEGQLVAVIER